MYRNEVFSTSLRHSWFVCIGLIIFATIFTSVESKPAVDTQNQGKQQNEERRELLY